MSSEVRKRQIDHLLALVAKGDNEAFSQLYSATSHGVFSIVYSYMNNYEDTEDIMQTVYLKIKLNIDSYKIGTNGGAWILSIAKNLALNELKKKRHTEDIDEQNAGSYEDHSSLEITEIMSKVLSKEEQEIVTLHVLWKYKHKEIAKMLNCPTGTITSKYKRAIE